MVAEPWILRMGNQVSNSFKSALLLENSSILSSAKRKQSQSQKGQQGKQVIGILSFEVANVMSKIIHLHKSLTDGEMLKLKNEILKSKGIKMLVCDDEMLLLEAGLVEKLDDLNKVASVVSRLGKKCTIPALQGFEHVYGDIVTGAIDVRELVFLVKDMEGMVRKMERYISSTASLYREMEILNELELATKKFEQNHNEESRKAFEQKVVWQKQDVRHLKDVSLWNQTYDKVVELLARTVCTVYARIRVVFGDAMLRREFPSTLSGVDIGPSWVLHHEKDAYGQNSSQPQFNAESKPQMSGDSIMPVLSKSNSQFHSGPIRRTVSVKKSTNFRPRVGTQRSEAGLLGTEDFKFACGIGPGRLFMECLSSSSSATKAYDDVDDDRSSQISGCCSVASSVKREQPNISAYCSQPVNGVPFSGDHRQLKGGMTLDAKFGPKSRIPVYAPPNTVGGSALALRYANVIIVIEKLLQYPHLIGEEARDDLYQMLPPSLRKTLRTSLKSYVKNLEIYDAPLAHSWKEQLDGILEWLAPLAHNMIRWQSERNFEQQQIVKRTNVLLLQTLYFADQAKTEAAICDLLIGLNYICRYEQQQNALLDCASSFDFEDCMEWQLQFGASFHS